MLKIEHLKKHYDNFSLDCSLELMSGCVTGLITRNYEQKRILKRSRFLPKNRFMKMYGDMTIRQTLII